MPSTAHKQKHTPSHSSHPLNPFLRTNSPPPPSLSLPLNRSSSSQLIPSSHELPLQQHYQQLERLLLAENNNLKEQAKYLATEVRKSHKKEKALLSEVKQLKEQLGEMDTALRAAEEETQQIRQFMESKVVELGTALTLPKPADSLNDVWKCLTQMCEYFSFELETIPSNSRETVPIIGGDQVMQPQQQQLGIEELSDRFEALMYEYSQTNQPELKQQCVQIAKQIRKLKQANVVSVFDQSDEYFSRFRRSLTRQNSYARVNSKQGRSSRSEHGDVSPIDTMKNLANHFTLSNNRKTIMPEYRPPSSGKFRGTR